LSHSIDDRKQTLSQALLDRQKNRQIARQKLIDTIGFKIPKSSSDTPFDTGSGNQGDASAVLANMDDTQKKLFRKGVLPSLSLSFKKATVALVPKSTKSRTIKIDQS